MYVTASEVLELTKCMVDDGAVLRAQAIVELMSGRPESAVVKIVDKQWLKYATAWQAAYMEHGDVFQQANVDKAAQDDSTIEIGDRIYAVSPLVVEALKSLSWRRTRSVKTKGWNFDRERGSMPWWYLW
ncbi:hypothetical protein [Nocardia sp. NPDC005366]|uniref:hypothetical protein n=1 Tax=Nocardia sp. NPDC005366 TaxID=3156878 RepID=UPI0033B3AC81